MEEALRMRDFTHRNVLKLLGVCLDADSQLPLVVLPFMRHGDLLSYLRDERNVRRREWGHLLTVVIVCDVVNVPSYACFCRRRSYAKHDVQIASFIDPHYGERHCDVWM